MKSILSKTSRTGGGGDDQRLLVIKIRCQRRPRDVRGSLLGRCNAPRCMDHFCRVRSDQGFLTGATGWRRSAPPARGRDDRTDLAGATVSPTGVLWRRNLLDDRVCTTLRRRRESTANSSLKTDCWAWLIRPDSWGFLDDKTSVKALFLAHISRESRF